MPRKFYRVENSDIDLNKVYISKEYQYGRNLDFSYYEHFLNVYFNVMKYENIPTDFLILINNNIYTLGNDYSKSLNDLIVDEEYLDLYSVTNSINHKGYKISISSLNKFIQSFDQNQQFIFFENGSFLWEFILEIVRFNNFNHLPKRLESIFLFDDIKSCQYYINNHLKGYGKIYEMELLEIEEIFEADMKKIDDIENHILFLDLFNKINDYWNGNFTDNPIKEIIFKGRYKYKKIV
jgi:hypothetical protein